jgi:twitching motility protein PilT
MDIETFNKILEVGVKNGASDIHLKAGSPVLYRVNGKLIEAKSSVLVPDITKKLVTYLVKSHGMLDQIDGIQEYDSSYAVKGVGRFRVNIFKQRGSFAVVLRVIPFETPTVESLGLPNVMKSIALEERGLILLTGITGSGKSTTLAAMIDEINANRKCHILTIEDPIEFIHRNKKSSLSQREIGLDTKNFALALRAALRQDPDVILVGEMRDLETVDIALKAAETGHLVLSTVHTTDAATTLARLISFFPAEEQGLIRIRIAENLAAVVSQRLLPKKSGKGRVLAMEIMIATKTIQECIKDPKKTGEIKDFIEKSKLQYHMQSFDQHLIELYKADEISFEMAKSAATNPSDFERAIYLDSVESETS